MCGDDSLVTKSDHVSFSDELNGDFYLCIYFMKTKDKWPGESWEFGVFCYFISVNFIDKING